METGINPVGLRAAMRPVKELCLRLINVVNEQGKEGLEYLGARGVFMRQFCGQLSEKVSERKGRI